MCSSCISSLVQKKCPECKLSFEAVPQVNYALMESMRQTQALRARIEAQQNVPAAAASTTPMCTEHTKKELDVWCHTCKTLLCEYCLRFGSHKSLSDHRTDLVTDAAAALREEIRAKFVEEIPPSDVFEPGRAYFTAEYHKCTSDVNSMFDRVDAVMQKVTDQRHILVKAFADHWKMGLELLDRVEPGVREVRTLFEAALDPSRTSDYQLLQSSPAAALQEKVDEIEAERLSGAHDLEDTQKLFAALNPTCEAIEGLIAELQLLVKELKPDQQLARGPDAKLAMSRFG